MIEKLDNNEQILLLHLAGELPPADQADVDRLLTADGGLRRSLAELQATQAYVEGELAALDQSPTSSVRFEAASRQAVRAMRQRLAQPNAVATGPAAERPARSWWWLYPTATAAGVLIVAMLWLNRLTGPTSLPAERPELSSGDSAGRSAVAIETPMPAPDVLPRPANPGAPKTLPSPPAIAQSVNAREADDALLLDSLKSPMTVDDQRPTSSSDDDSKRFALNDLGPVPQDEVSRLLLNANGVEQ